MKSISVHLTDQCNNSCIFCVVNSSQKKCEGVKKKVLYKFLEENSAKGYESVNIHGGEATVLPDFPDILAKIKELGYPQVSLQTNARKMADYEYTKQLYDLGVKLFVVSMHGKEAAQHDYVTRVDGSFDEAIQGIMNAKLVGGKVRTNTVVYKNNINDLSAIAEKLIGLKVDHINISAMHPVGKAYQNFNLVCPKYTEIQRAVFDMVDTCVKGNTVVTLEGFPNCILPEYENYMVDWEENQFKLLYHNYILDNYAAFMEKQTKKRVDACKNCSRKDDCGGVYKEYLEFFQDFEFHPV